MAVVEYAVTDRVARITLNRPERGNGITRALSGVRLRRRSDASAR